MTLNKNRIRVNDKHSVSKPTIVWFQQDFRLEDNPAILAAISRKAPIIPLYIWSPDQEWRPGEASKVWLHHSLLALKEELNAVGSSLIIKSGESKSVLSSLIEEMGAGALFWNRRYEPFAVRRDAGIEKELTKKNAIEIKSFNASLLYEPWEILQKNGKPYQVFTAFWHACAQYGEPIEPLKAPRFLLKPDRWPSSMTVEELVLLPSIPWDKHILEFWQTSAGAAKRRLKHFIVKSLSDYSLGRDRPDLDCVSYLSPYLHLGQLSPRQIYYSVKQATVGMKNKQFISSADTYLKELGWREFAYHLLYHFPETAGQPLREQYKKFPWRPNETYLDAWQKGRTGYPIVDAGMRQLWKYGWMHNRVRMIVASFLVKDLLIPWQSGAQWFWDTLIDADLANNTLGWQWTAGCGADAAPYFRIFNPVRQGQKFDPEGNYIKRFIPELCDLPIEFIHSPWLAGEDTLKKANIVLGGSYPYPIVNHAKARLKALESWKKTKQLKE